MKGERDAIARAQVLTELRNGATVQQAALVAGVSRFTIYKWAERGDEEVAGALPGGGGGKKRRDAFKRIDPVAPVTIPVAAQAAARQLEEQSSAPTAEQSNPPGEPASSGGSQSAPLPGAVSPAPPAPAPPSGPKPISPEENERMRQGALGVLVKIAQSGTAETARVSAARAILDHAERYKAMMVPQQTRRVDDEDQNTRPTIKLLDPGDPNAQDAISRRLAL